MKNVWKGLVVGGLTGVGAGIAMDLVSGGFRKVTEAGGKVAQHAPDVAERLLATAAEGAAMAREADVLGHVRQVAQRAIGSELTDHAREMAGQGGDRKEHR